jgi:N-acetylglucosaminyl-diphospho-decaprenol L-rhamnosyltransferase
MRYVSPRVAVSIVSHNHGSMVWKLVRQIISFKEVDKIYVTLNVPELFPVNLSDKVILIHNTRPKGFGENHNAAFDLINNEFYCVLNPDIEFIENPFPFLISLFSDAECGVVAPIILDDSGSRADTARQDLTAWLLINRIFGFNCETQSIKILNDIAMPDWVAGMFMLFRSKAFNKVGKFDQKYFMYCEDADICRRLRTIQYQVLVSLKTSVVHKAQRASRRNLKHFIWHLKSLILYFLKYSD